MRVEQFHLLIYGAVFTSVALFALRFMASQHIKLHLKAFCLALGLGLIIVPGHGELIIAPLLAVLVAPFRIPLVALGGIYFVVWWLVALFILKQLAYHSSKLKKP